MSIFTRDGDNHTQVFVFVSDAFIHVKPSEQHVNTVHIKLQKPVLYKTVISSMVLSRAQNLFFYPTAFPRCSKLWGRRKGHCYPHFICHSTEIEGTMFRFYVGKWD